MCCSVHGIVFYGFSSDYFFGIFCSHQLFEYDGNQLRKSIIRVAKMQFIGGLGALKAMIKKIG